MVCHQLHSCLISCLRLIKMTHLDNGDSKLFEEDMCHHLNVAHEQCHQAAPASITVIEFQCLNCVHLCISRFGLQSLFLIFTDNWTTDICLKLKHYQQQHQQQQQQQQYSFCFHRYLAASRVLLQLCFLSISCNFNVDQG